MGDVSASANVPAAIFSRRSTGLIREASLWNVFAFNVNMQNIVIGVVFNLLLIPSLYPSANIYVSTLIALVAAIPASYVYARLAAAFPRSGGDYVFVSRVVHPAIGFMSNFSYCVWGAFYVGVTGVFLGLYGIAPTLRVLGAYVGSSGLADSGNFFATQTGKFLMAIGLVVLFIAIFTVGGLRLYFRIQSVSFVLASATLAFLVLYGLLASSQPAFSQLDAQIHRLGGGSLSALAAGPAAGFDWKQTIFASIWPWSIFNSAIYSTYIGGEIKRADRNQLWGIMGAVLWAGVWTLLLTWAMLHLFGNAFFANLGVADPNKFGLSSTPTFGEVTALSVGNTFVALLVMIGFTLWTYVWVAPYTTEVTRSMLAWSLDRVAPSPLARVSERWHSPVVALMVVLVFGIISAALYSYFNLSVLTGTVGITASMIVVAIAGILLPYRRPDLWRTTPGHGRIAGLPLVSVIGVIAIALLLLIEWALLADINSGTSVQGSPNILAITGILFVIGLPIYYIARLIQSRRGVDIDLAFKEIPPE